jgi:hypothetical protein
MSTHPATPPHAATERTYLRGDRVEAADVPANYRRFALAPGDRGTVEFTDSLGTIHVRWDGGQHCGIITEAAYMIRNLSRETEQ